MKSSMKKFFVTCAAVSAVSVCAAASAMAADFTQAPAYSDDDTNTVKIVVPADIDAAKQATVLVVPKDKVNEVTDEDILYINQGLTSDNGMTTLKLKGTSKLDDGTYTVKFGGYVGETFTLYSGDFTVGDAVTHTVLLGDVVADFNTIDTADAQQVLRHAVRGSAAFSEDKDKLIAANVTANVGVVEDTPIDTADAQQILRYAVRGTTTTNVGKTATVDAEYNVISID